MARITDAGIEWYNQYGIGEAAGPLDTIAVGTGTDAEAGVEGALQSEVYRASLSDAVVRFEPHDTDPTITYAIITLTGGTEVPAGEEISEVGVLTTATDPETLVWYGTRTPVPFDGGLPTKLTFPMDLSRVTD